MKTGFYYLDFKDKKILGPMTPEEICVTGKVLKRHPEEFEIMISHRSETVTGDFYCHKNGYWKHSPLRPVNARNVKETLLTSRKISSAP